jgi:hypothetical protein
LLSAGILPAEPVRVAADFSVAADYPLSKSKFAVFNSGFVPMKHYERDQHLYREAQPAALRVDLWWGGTRWKPPVISGTSTSLVYNFSEMDQMASLLNACGVAPYWAYCYVPGPLQSEPGDHRSTPISYSAWGKILNTYAAHAASGPKENRVRYHEIYNEPDNRDFFSGGINDYLQMYKSGVNGIRSGDADAVVGGPAIAFTDAWVSPFLDYVQKESLPLDFFSFHYYPTVPYNSSNIAGVLRDMRAKLSAYPDLASTEMHLNEYNSFKIDYPLGGRQDRHTLASAMLSDFHYFLTQPDLTMVHWAQFQDTGGGNWSGMISEEGHRKATFNAYALYQHMPEDRASLNISNPGVEGFASTDGRRSAVLLWNTVDQPCEVAVQLQNLPQGTEELKVSRIDAMSGSWGDNNANESISNVDRQQVAGANHSWRSHLPGNGIVYMEALANAPPSDQDTEALPLQVVRSYKYFPDRNSTSYADFNEQTLTFRLGSGQETSATTQMAALLESDIEHLDVQVECDSLASSTVEIRFDYGSNDCYTSSVAFLWGPETASKFQRGKWSPAGNTVRVSSSTETVDVEEYAPLNRKNRLLVSVTLSAPRGQRCKIALQPGSRTKFNYR